MRLATEDKTPAPIGETPAPRILKDDKSTEPLWLLERDGATQSLLTAFSICPEKVRLAWREGWSGSKVSGAIAFGSVVHETLDQVYTMAKGLGWRDLIQDRDESDIIQAAQLFSTTTLQQIEKKEKAELAKNLISWNENESQETYGLAEVLLEGYWEHWYRDLIDTEWVALEQSFDLWFNGPTESAPSFRVRGKIDGLFRNSRGELWILETKTKSQIREDDLFQTLGYDLQICLYSWAAKQLYGAYPRGVLYNVMRKPQLRQKVAEALPTFLERCKDDISGRPDFYFKRYEISLMPADMKRAVGEIEARLLQLADWEGGLPESSFRNRAACYLYGSACPYVGICGANNAAGLHRREVVFPELEEPILSQMAAEEG